MDYTSLSLIRTITESASALSCVSVLITPDNLTENCADEVFGINLTAVSPRVTIENGSAIIELVDDDLPGGKKGLDLPFVVNVSIVLTGYLHTDVSVVMEEAQYTCSETNTTCEVSVLLLSPESVIGCDVTITLAAVNGTKAGRLVWLLLPI